MLFIMMSSDAPVFVYARETIARRTEDAKRELEEDLFYLQESLQHVAHEADSERERKIQFAKEAKMYNEYVKQMREYEKEHERSIDAFFCQEQDKVYHYLEKMFCCALSKTNLTLLFIFSHHKRTTLLTLC